jgi:hypothetical protein
MVCKSDSTSVLTTGTSYAPSITATTTYYVGCKDNTTTCETATNSRQAVVGTVIQSQVHQVQVMYQVVQFAEVV